jgi:hypothetical protein
MANRRNRSADNAPSAFDQVLPLCLSLPPDDREMLIDKLLDCRRASQIDDSRHWVTLAEAAESLERTKSQISRYVKQGRLLSNGKKSRHLRVLHISVCRVLCEEIRKQLRQFPGNRLAKGIDASNELLELITNHERRIAEKLGLSSNSQG